MSINFASVAKVDQQLARRLLDKLKEDPTLAELLTEVHPDALRKFPKLQVDTFIGGPLRTLLQGLDLVIGASSLETDDGPHEDGQSPQ